MRYLFDKDELLTASEVAKAAGISYQYLNKVLQRLNYLQAYMKTSTNDELTSGLLPFSTKPEITSMTVSHSTDHDKVLVSAVLPTNSPNLVDITDVTIYWDTDSNIVTNPSLAGNSITLTSGQYSNSGFTDVLAIISHNKLEFSLEHICKFMEWYLQICSAI